MIVTTTETSSTWNAKLKIMSTERDLLLSKIERQALNVKAKSRAYARSVVEVVNELANDLDPKSSTGSYMLDARRIARTLHAIATICEDDRYSLEHPIEKAEEMQIELDNLNE